MTDAYLTSTHYIESRAPAIVELADELKGKTTTASAIACFDWVRDNIRYDPYTALDPPEMYRATKILERRRGYCVQKAVLLASLTRALAIPARLGFADVRNHKSPPKMLAAMGTNLFVFHGYVELELDGRWVKATPAFDGDTSERAGVLPVELDGTGDAMFQPVDPEGHPFIEYIRDRGSYADLPLEEILQAIDETYGAMIEKAPKSLREKQTDKSSAK